MALGGFVQAVPRGCFFFLLLRCYLSPPPLPLLAATWAWSTSIHVWVHAETCMPTCTLVRAMRGHTLQAHTDTAIFLMRAYPISSANKDSGVFFLYEVRARTQKWSCAKNDNMSLPTQLVASNCLTVYCGTQGPLVEHVYKPVTCPLPRAPGPRINTGYPSTYMLV